ncbi:MAG: ribosome-associated translation inhibitor RaiA [Ignavibacteria bacterium]|nr:ribosome-associated translation inhibitor RaiA [Ignavibacteria bacterium]
MDIHFTARKFKARDSIREHAIEAIKKLDKYYDGIVRGDIILSYERTTKSLKTAEINLHVYGTILTATEKSDDYLKSIYLAIDKLERQLAKYKMKLRMKNKKTLRRVKEEVGVPISEDEE